MYGTRHSNNSDTRMRVLLLVLLLVMLVWFAGLVCWFAGLVLVLLSQVCKLQHFPVNHIGRLLGFFNCYFLCICVCVCVVVSAVFISISLPCIHFPLSLSRSPCPTLCLPCGHFAHFRDAFYFIFICVFVFAIAVCFCFFSLFFGFLFSSFFVGRHFCSEIV